MSQSKEKVHTKERIHRYVSSDFSLRASAVNATAVVQHMQQITQAKVIPAIAVGRTMVGALLMAANLKEGQEVGVLIKGNGPIGYIYAQAGHDGKVRGYTHESQFELPKYEENIKLKDAIGSGYMTVVRHQPFQRQPYQGTVELVSGEIGDDIAYYLHQSQQIRSIISLGVYIDMYGLVRSAGGVLIEVMPGVEGEIIEKLEANVAKSKAQVSKMILEGQPPEALIKPYLEGFAMTEIPHDYEINYSCPCTKDRVREALTILGLEELDDMIQKGETSSITCQMCGRKYDMNTEEITEVRNRLYKDSLH